MIGHDHEDRVFEPRLRLRGLQEGADGVVGIGDAAFATDQTGVDLAGRPSIRTVVRSRHHEVMEGLARGVGAVGLFERPRESVLIAGAPGVGEGRLLTSAELARQVDDVVAVGLEEIVHVVEEPVAAVEEGRLVALGLQDRAQGREVLTTRAAQDGLTRDRRDGQRQRLHAADRTRAAGVTTREPEGLTGKAVEVRRQVLGLKFRRTVATDVFRAQAFDRDLDDVPLTGGHRWRDAAGDVVLPPFGGGLAALGEQGRAELRDGIGTRRIEAMPFELIGPEGGQEGVFAVLGQFGVVAVRPARLDLAHVTEARGEPFGDRRARGAGDLEVVSAHEIGDEQQDQQRRQERGEVAPAGRGIGGGAFFPATHEAETAPEQEQPRRDGEHDADDQRQVVGLADVLHDLRRVDEVVDRDEVEADAELLPEEDLGDLPEREEEGAEKPGRAERQPQPAGGRP